MKYENTFSSIIGTRQGYKEKASFKNENSNLILKK